MKRRLLVAALVFGGAAFAHAPTASAAPEAPRQNTPCFPPDPLDYPPSGLETDLDLTLAISGGLLLPQVESGIRLRNGFAHLEYCAVLFSEPVTIQPAAADRDGDIAFDVDLPATFEQNSAHHLDVFSAGRLVGAFDFCVDEEGEISDLDSCVDVNGELASSDALPRTGAQRAFEALRIAGGLLGVSGFVLYLRRRAAAGRASAT